MADMENFYNDLIIINLYKYKIWNLVLAIIL